ncbi:hemin transporter [Nocardia beijingensis]|uniref:globin domain-containing protein n=1 Tax=Nocardia beijingensis TaxID=95162 RepID=UPI0018954252|nr:globin domain-containing protein [Nocardia beijingensis]MBF6463970.1 hemin transporter [Nocardia beijingensis]
MTLDSVVRAQPELEPRHADVVRATLPLVAANIDRITAVFYRTMFDAHPQLLRDTFNRGNQAQGNQQRALAGSIATFATYLVDPALPHPATMLSRIAHKHASLGVTPEQYRIVHDNLFAAIVEVLGADVVDETVASAWDRVYWLMADTLMDQERGLYAEAGVDSGDVFRDVLVLAREDDPSGVAIFTVGSADPNTELPGFAPGQYVSVGVRLPDGARQLRQYSLVGRPGDGVLSFAVKRVDPVGGCPAGEVSSWLHEQLRPGDRLQVTLPFGDVVIDTAAQTPLVLISAGIGVTPTIGALESLAAHAPCRRTLIVHADRAPRTHPLRDRLLRLAARLEQAEVEIWYEEQGPGARRGRADLSALDLPQDADVYVCGPSGFLREIQGQLRALGIPDARVHVEQFAPGDAGAPGRVAR